MGTGSLPTPPRLRQQYQLLGRPVYVNRLRHRQPRPIDKWPLDAVFLVVTGESYSLKERLRRQAAG